MWLKIVRAVNWVIIFGLVVVTVVPANERPATDLQHDLEHFLAFGLAGLMFGIAYARSLGANFTSAILFALALELSQIPLPTRHARLEDFVVDALAACLGIAIAHFCRKSTEPWLMKTSQS
jgi:VanZ family protein